MGKGSNFTKEDNLNYAQKSNVLIHGFTYIQAVWYIVNSLKLFRFWTLTLGLTRGSKVDAGVYRMVKQWFKILFRTAMLNMRYANKIILLQKGSMTNIRISMGKKLKNLFYKGSIKHWSDILYMTPLSCFYYVCCCSGERCGPYASSF